MRAWPAGSSEGGAAAGEMGRGADQSTASQTTRTPRVSAHPAPITGTMVKMAFLGAPLSRKPACDDGHAWPSAAGGFLHVLFSVRMYIT